MYVNISEMRPNDGYESETVESMHRYGKAAREQAGLLLVTTLKDRDSGHLFGVAVWESEDAARAAGSALMAAVAEDDFDTWMAEMSNRRLDEV